MTTWVLLRGLMREKRHWGEFPAQFQKAIGADHVATLDFPGNGRFHAQASAASVPAMANSIRTQLGQSGFQPPYSVLALSLGAMAAVAWSETYPAELERMVLISTSLAPYSPFSQRLRPANYPALIRSLLAGSTREAGAANHQQSEKRGTAARNTGPVDRLRSGMPGDPRQFPAPVSGCRPFSRRTEAASRTHPVPGRAAGSSGRRPLLAYAGPAMELSPPYSPDRRA